MVELLYNHRNNTETVENVRIFLLGTVPFSGKSFARMLVGNITL